MRTIHICVGKFESETEFLFADAWLRMIAGVADVATVPSAGLLSVLYDEHKTGPRSILGALRESGFDARPCDPDDVLPA